MSKQRDWNRIRQDKLLTKPPRHMYMENTPTLMKFYNDQWSILCDFCGNQITSSSPGGGYWISEGVGVHVRCYKDRYDLL